MELDISDKDFKHRVDIDKRIIELHVLLKPQEHVDLGDKPLRLVELCAIIEAVIGQVISGPLRWESESGMKDVHASRFLVLLSVHDTLVASNRDTVCPLQVCEGI